MSKQRIFDSIEHLKHECNLNVEIPKDIPEGCNVICYNTATGSPYLYKEEGELLYYFASNKTWCLSALETLEGEVEWDKDNLDKSCVYLRLATKDNSDVFTPERLLGVGTDKGFVEGIASVDSNIYLITGSHIISASRCKFYISDYSDETVSFEEYVNKFYDGGVCGNKQGKVSCL